MSASRLALSLALAASLCAGAALATELFPNATRAGAPQFAEDEKLAAAIAAPSRKPENKARDSQRRPYESLTFWGLQPGMTVVEIGPGGGAWWSEILYPYAQATGGRYIAGYNDSTNPQMSEGAKKARADFNARFGNSAVDFGMNPGLAVPDASADLVLVARAYHNWIRTEGQTDRYMREFFRALKPGGILAVEEQRAPEGSALMEMAANGYVTESYVIEAAKRAGFVLDGRSELNANPRDTRDHPFGVWTLPPVRRSAPAGQPADPNFDHSKYDAIGEADRMTLRFRKPG